MMRSKILVIEDSEDIYLLLQMKLEADGYAPEGAATGAEALVKFAEQEWDLVLLDHMLPDTDGLSLLTKIRERDKDIPIIYMTAFSSVPLAVKAIKLGAYDYLTKPFDLEQVQVVIRKALELTALRAEVRNLRQSQQLEYGFHKVVGCSEKIRQILETCKTVAESEASSVLLTGESGTGKNLIAQAIHCNSRRAGQPFLTITCTSLPEQLLESELFGHERGAFTDAKERKKGLFELGNGGTIFLDEIGDLPMTLQAKLLGVLESRRIRRVGGTTDIAIDARIVAATNQDLREAIANKRFRGDLFYRINVIQLEIPALRERIEDLPILVQHFINEFNGLFKKDVKGISKEALDAMSRYDWPGNIRELRNLIERAMILGRGELLVLKDFPSEIRGSVEPAKVIELPSQGINLDELEKSLIIQALEQTSGNQTRAAQLLNLSRDQLRYRIKAQGITLEEGN